MSGELSRFSAILATAAIGIAIAFVIAMSDMRAANCIVFIILAMGCSSTGNPSRGEPDAGAIDTGDPPTDTGIPSTDAADSSSKDTEIPSTDTGSPSTDAGTDTGIPPTDAAPCAPGTVWKTTSAKVALRMFGFFAGSSGYEQDRASLTAGQHSALDALCIIPTPSRFAADAPIYRIAITDDDGSQSEYYAAYMDLIDRDYGRPMIGYASLEPFLKTFSCLNAGQTRPSTPGPPPGSIPDVSADPACRNGIFMPYQCHQVWLRLNVPAAAIHELALEGCFGTTTLKIFAADKMTELASSAPGTSTACPTLSYAFEAGPTLVRVDKTNGDIPCDGMGSAGDFFLRVDPTSR